MCNIITDWLMVIITTVYVIATIAICVFNGKSAKAAQKQLSASTLQQEENIKIQLAYKRIEIISFFDEQIDKIMSNWDFNLSPYLESFRLKNEIAIYFNHDFVKFYSDLLKTIESMNMLLGDFKYAEEHGECKNRNIQDIQHEIEQEKIAIDEHYKTIKNQMKNKYLDFTRS